MTALRRTTIWGSPEVFEQLKESAYARGITLGDVCREAFSLYLSLYTEEKPVGFTRCEIGRNSSMGGCRNIGTNEFTVNEFTVEKGSKEKIFLCDKHYKMKTFT